MNISKLGDLKKKSPSLTVLFYSSFKSNGNIIVIVSELLLKKCNYYRNNYIFWRSIVYMSTDNSRLSSTIEDFSVRQNTLKLSYGTNNFKLDFGTAPSRNFVFKCLTASNPECLTIQIPRSIALAPPPCFPFRNYRELAIFL